MITFCLAAQNPIKPVAAERAGWVPLRRKQSVGDLLQKARIGEVRRLGDFRNVGQHSKH